MSRVISLMRANASITRLAGTVSLALTGRERAALGADEGTPRVRFGPTSREKKEKKFCMRKTTV